MSAPTLDLVRAGRRAIVTRPLERGHLGPDAYVPAGTAGEVVYADADVVSWRPDGPPIKALASWDGCFDWYAADCWRADDPDALLDARRAFLRDCGAIV